MSALCDKIKHFVLKYPDLVERLNIATGISFENCEEDGLKLCTRLKKVTGDYSHSEHNIKPTQSQGGEISGR